MSDRDLPTLRPPVKLVQRPILLDEVRLARLLSVPPELQLAAPSEPPTEFLDPVTHVRGLPLVPTSGFPGSLPPVG